MVFADHRGTVNEKTLLEANEVHFVVTFMDRN
jgi:hypothetical protein